MEEFDIAMREAGIVCKERIVADGHIHRFANNGKGDRDCWYVSFGMAGAFGDWSQGTSQKWNASQPTGITPQEKGAFQRQREQAREALKMETQRAHEETAGKALGEWEGLGTSGQSSYLGRKAIAPVGIRFGEDFIAVPLKDAEGKLWSFQKIYGDGAKRFLKGGRKKGCFHHLGHLRDRVPIYVVEGYATGASVYGATHQATAIAFDANNLAPVIGELKRVCPNSPITIAADDDAGKTPNTGREKAEAAAKEWNCGIVFPRFKDRSTNPTDFNDLMLLEGQEEASRQLKAVRQSTLCCINVERLLTMDIPPREMLLEPVIPEQGLAMLYAPRGIGKTHVALSIAHAVANGGQMFQGKWSCQKAARVLFVDGEMPANALRDRVCSILAGAEELANIDNLQFINPDFQQGYTAPDLARPEGQQQVEEHLSGVRLLILDNLSALCRSGKENESESWIPIQSWLLKLRSQGISVLFVHHANKTGNQRGTSRKEDMLDTVVVLRKPADYHPQEGARFEVHYEKARGFYGVEARPFEAWLKGEDDKTFWQIRELETCQSEKIMELHREGLKQRDIAQEIGVSAATVNRAIKKAKEGGLFHD